jgi:alpha-methylacyl-CoA racemase
VAVARLVALGATARKIEPPGGDALRTFAPAWFERLHAGVARETLDLKTDAGRQALDQALVETDVLVTSQRPSALERLGLGRDRLTRIAPTLHVVRIVGDLRDPERPGHDLTYQADAGLLDDRLPPTLLADLVGAEHAVTAVLLALRSTPGSWRDVGLRDALEVLTPPLTHGLTAAGGPLGGGLAAYGIYAAADGHVAVGALEPHFRARLYQALGLPLDAPLAAVIASRRIADLIALARQHDFPLDAVRRGWGLGTRD